MKPISEKRDETSGINSRSRLFKLFTLIEAVCLLFIALSLFLNLITRSLALIAGYFTVLAGCFLLTYGLRKVLFEKGSLLIRIVYFTTLTLLVRLPVCVFLNLTPQGDYGGFLSIAHKLYTGQEMDMFYFGIFPHSINFPAFLTFLYQLLGEHTWVPRAVNLVLGSMEAGFAAGIMEMCAGRKAGAAAGIFVALNPSILVFTLLPGGEYLYSALLTGAFFFFTLSLREQGSKRYLYLSAAGVFCAAGNYFRPTGILFVLAVLLYYFLFSKARLKQRLGSAAVLMAIFLIGSTALGLVTTSVSGYEKPSSSYGWNLYVGGNYESGGAWSSEDAQAFEEAKTQYAAPSLFQSHFAELGLERYWEMGLRIPEHFKNKLALWNNEAFTAGVITGWQSVYTRFQSSDLYEAYTDLITRFNGLVLFGALLAMAGLSITGKTEGTLRAMSVYMLGAMVAFMILEFAGRYKGAFYSTLTMLSVYGYMKAWILLKKWKQGVVIPSFFWYH